MARFFKTNGMTRFVHPKNGKTFTLNELQAYVGGYIETLQLSDGRIMVVNEEGKLNGMAYNHYASICLRKNSNVLDDIVGDALVCNSDEIE